MSRQGGPRPEGDPTDRDQPDTSPRSASVEDDDRFREQFREASTTAFRRVEATAPGVAARIRAIRERVRKRRSLDTAWRMMVLALGLTLVAAGLVMFVLPGPGFGALILGLVVLASEFTWATRVLDPVKDAARRASEAAMDPRRRTRNLILGAIAGVAVAIALTWYLSTYGWTLQPMWDLVGAVVDWIRGLFT